MEIASFARSKAKGSYVDMLIVDAARRTSVDEALRSKLSRIEEAVEPVECLLAIDAMMGQ